MLLMIVVLDIASILSVHRIGRVFPSTPWHPRVLLTLNETLPVSSSMEIVSIVSSMLYRSPCSLGTDKWLKLEKKNSQKLAHFCTLSPIF